MQGCSIYLRWRIGQWSSLVGDVAVRNTLPISLTISSTGVCHSVEYLIIFWDLIIFCLRIIWQYLAVFCFCAGTLTGLCLLWTADCQSFSYSSYSVRWLVHSSDRNYRNFATLNGFFQGHFYHCYQSNEISIDKIHFCTAEMAEKLHHLM